MDTGRWYLCNDDDVTIIADEDIEEKVVTNKAYFLFYERRNSNVYNVYQKHTEAE